MEDLTFGSRLVLAFSLPFRVLFNGSLAAQIAQLDSLPALPGKVEVPEAAVGESKVAKAESSVATVERPFTAVEAEADLTPALQLLSILQREGRFIDFLQEDMSSFSDEDIGAAARVVQEGCKRGLADYIELAVVRSEAEGASVTLEPGYDANETRVTGNVTGTPPYRGSLAHHGWRAESIRLPKLSSSHDARILAPAEVEI